MSSHREAPEISKDPVADSTDVYAFVSPDKPDTVTLIANYIPLQEPAGGPNFYEFGDDVLYAIHIDNTGNGEADLSFEFRFRTAAYRWMASTDRSRPAARTSTSSATTSSTRSTSTTPATARRTSPSSSGSAPRRTGGWLLQIGAGRRPELLRVRRRRPLRDPHRQHRQRRGGPLLRVPVPHRGVQVDGFY